MHYPQKNVALIGAGGFGQSHFRELLERGPVHGLRLTAIADPSKLSPDIIAACADKAIQRYEDFRVMLDKESLDGVIIPAPIPLHFELAREVIRRGLPVYLEKPPVASTAQLEELIQAGNDRIQVGFHIMSWEKTLSALRLIEEGAFGSIRTLRVLALWPRGSTYYNRSGWAGKLADAAGRPTFDGPATNAAAHYVQWMATAARAGHLGDPTSIRGEFFRARPIESYDTCSIRGQFAAGAKFCAVMSHAWHGRAETFVRIGTDAGELEFDGQRVAFSESAAKPGLLQRIGGILAKMGSLTDPETVHSLERSHADFGRLLREPGTRPRVTPADCRDFIKMTFGLLEAGAPIATIPPDCIDVIQDGDADFYAIRDLREATRRCLEDFQTFSEAGIAWAQPSP